MAREPEISERVLECIATRRQLNQAKLKVDLLFDKLERQIATLDTEVVQKQYKSVAEFVDAEHAIRRAKQLEKARA